MTRLPSLIALRAFDAVGRMGSVRAAGEELHVSPTVISRHLHNLEQELGLVLVVAKGRGLALTPAGEAFYTRLRRGFDLLRQAVEEARPAPRGSLNIWCVPGIAQRRFLPRLPALQSELAELEIQLQPTLTRPDFARGEADAEIVYLAEEPTLPALRAELLAMPVVFPVASPALLARYPSIRTLADLLTLPLLHEESTLQWEQWLTMAGLCDMPALKGPRLWHAHLTIEAARLGQGIALTNRLLAEDDLISGKLVEIPGPAVKMGAYYLITPAAMARDPALAKLRRWLKRSLEA